MVNTSCKLLFSVAMCALAVGSYASQSARKVVENAPTKPVAPRNARSVFDGYLKWSVVNAEPLYISSLSAALCATQSASGSHHPSNEGKYIRVFVNSKGRATMFTTLKSGAKKLQFPVGSVIVKQKLAKKKSRAPELLTVMVKEKAGYDAKNGDWRYLVANGSGSKVYPRVNITNCQSCHASQKDADYTFRTYLPKT